MADLLNDLAERFVLMAGESIRGLELHLARSTVVGRFKAHFGVSPLHCAWLWLLSEDKLYQKDYNVKRIHLLWTLNVMKTDDTEAVLKGRWGVDEKTIRKWLYVVLEVLSNLQAVSLSINQLMC